MIVKHVPMKTVKKSDFASLVKYITDKQSKEHRLGEVRISNCASADMKAAVSEIVATQKCNTRSTSDKTYHLIVSFREGENPQKKVLEEIEDRICSVLGFSKHQRISAIHNDTDNLHFHIAINKINPVKNTIHEPYKAYKKLAELCVELEKEFGLEKDNHEQKHTISENRVHDMERHSGVESLASWVRDNSVHKLKNCSTWDEIHQICAENNLILKKRGAGLVFQSSEIIVKASTVDRELSKAALEKKLGEFEQSEYSLSDNSKHAYQAKPKDMEVETASLYSKFKESNSFLSSNRSIELQALRTRKKEACAEAKKKYKRKVIAIKLLKCSRLIKTILFKRAYKSFQSNIDSIGKSSKKTQNTIYQKYKKRTWADWLKHESELGNSDALKALRKRKKDINFSGNSIYSGKKIKTTLFFDNRKIDCITKKGSVMYRNGLQCIRESANQLKTNSDATDFTILSALDMAIEKFGYSLSLNGTPEFKAKIIKLSVYFKRKIKLTDHRLESIKRNLEKEMNYEQRTRNDGRRSGRTSAIGIRRRETSGRIQGGNEGSSNFRGSVSGNQRCNSKPNIVGVGKAPPPESRNNLRNLSKLGVVHISGRSKVLLPSNVPSDLEQQRTEPTNSMRWSLFGSGVTEKHVSAARQYIEERERKRAKGIDISKHSLYTGAVDKPIFAGIRNIDEFAVALLGVGNELIEVLPVDKATVKRLSRLKIGDPITVTNKGSIRVKKGRSL